jgi:hypothetical protein
MIVNAKVIMEDDIKLVLVLQKIDGANSIEGALQDDDSTKSRELSPKILLILWKMFNLLESLNLIRVTP